MLRATLASAREVLLRYFGYPDFRAPQLPAIEAVLSRRDAVIVLPTGGGKSICFQVPALCFDRLTVVISPLISLMADQVQALERRGINATYLNSTLSPDESARRVERLRRGEVRILYVAPERLAAGNTIDLLARTGVDLLAIDEAHCVSEWGQDFRPSYLRLAALRRRIGDPQTVALTATATPRVRRDVARLLELREPLFVVGGFDRPNLDFHVRSVKDDGERHQVMVKTLKAARDPVVVYAATRRQVEFVARLVSSGGVRVVAYHAGLAAERRAKAQEAFMSGTSQAIVATNAFGMGIDKPNVRLVLHYLHSGSLEDYYQEAGRAGRDGERSQCILLFNKNDRQIHDRMRDHGKVGGDLLRAVWQFVARSSNGRRRVPLDAAFIASRLGLINTDSVSAAIGVLQDRGVLSDLSQADFTRIRLLGSELRIECERTSLSTDSRLLLDQLKSSLCRPDQWHVLSVLESGLSPHRFSAALAELESRQLVFADRAPARALARNDAAARAEVERLIVQLKHRHDVERAKLASMVGYATALMCRRRYILNYFGDQSSETTCGQCDVCST